MSFLVAFTCFLCNQNMQLTSRKIFFWLIYKCYKSLSYLTFCLNRIHVVKSQIKYMVWTVITHPALLLACWSAQRSWLWECLFALEIIGDSSRYCIYMYVCVCVCVCMYVFMYVCVCSWDNWGFVKILHVYVCICICIYICIYVYTHTHTHIYI